MLTICCGHPACRVNDIECETRAVPKVLSHLMCVISGWHDPSETKRGCLCSGSLDISYVVFAGTNGFRFGGTFTTAAAAAVTGVPAISGSATQVRARPKTLNPKP